MDREIAEALAARREASTTPGYPRGRRYMLVNDHTGKDMREAHDFEINEIQKSRFGTKQLALQGGAYSARLRDMDEKFTLTDRAGNILGESSTLKGAMSKAPKDESYAAVSGEYTSDGRYWGPGKGRRMAVREFHPSGGFRWYVG